MADKLKKLTAVSQKKWIIMGVVVAIVIVFFYLRSGSSSTGGPNNSSVVGAPNIQNLPGGGKVSPEYYKAVLANNALQAKKAEDLGQTSIATLVNTETPGFAAPAAACPQSCCNCAPPTAQSTVQGWLAAGKISKETGQSLDDLAKKDLSVDDYASALQQMVRDGKLTPEQARELLEQYKKQHGADLAKAGASKIDGLIKSGALPLDAGNNLLDLQQNGASLDSYAQELAAMVRAGKISKETAAQLLAEYKKRHGGLEAVSLDQLISTGLPDSFNAGTDNNQGLANPNFSQTALPNTSGFAGMKRTKPAFQDAQVAAAPMSPQEQALLAARQQQIQIVATSMTTQASGIISGNAPTLQAAVVAEPDTTMTGQAISSGNNGSAGANSDQAPTVKAGDIEFAVLDTAVNSDYPSSPVMATIVQGKLKGGKLLGQLSKGDNSNNDRVILTFTLLNMPDWPKPVGITAVAIDPETARSALATSVDYHYLTRYGALFSSAFLAGYGQTFTQAGQTVIPGAGSSSGQPYVIPATELSPVGRVFAGLGQVGTQTSAAAQQYFNTPPTVKVNSGVGLGILFMQNVSSTATVPPSVVVPPPASQVPTGVPATPGQEVTQSNNK